MSAFLINLITFLVAISVLVAIHEYGHFIVGRWSGMKVLRFSIGFGKPIWTRVGKKDETEFCISALPLGGYVRFLDSREGDIAAEDQGRAFDQRPISARIAVLLAGPLFNLIFAVVIYWFVFLGGETDIKPVVGVVKADSFAAQAGLEHGDTIIAVGDTLTESWGEAQIEILTEMVDDGRVPLTLQKVSGRQQETLIDVGAASARLTEPGEFWSGLGMQPWQRPAEVGSLTDDSAAARAGLRSGDVITAINGQPVSTFTELRTLVLPLYDQLALLQYERFGSAMSTQIEIGSSEFDGKQVGSLGIIAVAIPEEMITRRTYTPLQSVSAALDKTWQTTTFTLTMLGRMVTGDVSIKNISGPINIAQITGQSVVYGWDYFINVLAVISISLGVLNLLPIPILDGGQIVYQLIEAAKGSPITERTQILGQQVGILALLLLMSFAFYNDIERIFG